jgi:hypothetical protein
VGGRSTKGVVRIGETVHRPSGPWTQTVHRFLYHLRSRGFTGAPLSFGFDSQGREVLEYIPGDTLSTPQDPAGPLILVPYPEAWRSDAALEAAGTLIRSLHEASKGFTTENASWRLFDRAMKTGEIICHADHGPWNSVYRDGLPVALIDWDSARPDEPILDLAIAAWHFVPLVDDDEARALGYDDVEYGRRLRAFLDAYGLEDRSRFFDALRQVKAREADLPRFWGLGPEDASEFGRRLERDLRWLMEHQSELTY